MSAKRLGRFTAGLFVALGLAFGGSLLAGGNDAAHGSAAPVTVSSAASQIDIIWG